MSQCYFGEQYMTANQIAHGRRMADNYITLNLKYDNKSSIPNIFIKLITEYLDTQCGSIVIEIINMNLFVREGYKWLNELKYCLMFFNHKEAGF